MSVLGMACIPFAMKKADNLGFWFVCLTAGVFLTVLNYALAVGAIGKARDNETNSAASLRAASERLEKQIKELKLARSSAPSFKHTSEEMVSSAREAVNLAIVARDQECGKVGDNCRARVAQLAARQADLAEILGNREATRKADERDASLRSLESDLSKLGTIPERVDPQAERLGNLLRTIGIERTTQAVADGLISILAITAEVFALVMPRILVTALAPATVLVALAGPSGGTTAPKQLAPPKATSKSPPVARPPASAADWLRAYRPAKGSKLDCWTAYQAYKKWCNGALSPVSYTAFMFEMSAVKKSEEAGKAYFIF